MVFDSIELTEENFLALVEIHLFIRHDYILFFSRKKKEIAGRSVKNFENFTLVLKL